MMHMHSKVHFGWMKSYCSGFQRVLLLDMIFVLFCVFSLSNDITCHICCDVAVRSRLHFFLVDMALR